MKMFDVLKGVVIGLAMLGCLSLGVWHGAVVRRCQSYC
jgi:hypothetical protein